MPDKTSHHQRKPRIIDDQTCWLCAHCKRWKPRNRFYGAKAVPSSYCMGCQRAVAANPLKQHVNGPYLCVVERFQAWAEKRGEAYSYAASRALTREMGEKWLLDDDD